MGLKRALKSVTNFVSDVISFEKSNLGTMIDSVKEQPTKLLVGAADPFGAELHNTLGTNKLFGEDEYEPVVNVFGGATERAYQEAEAKGIDTGPGAAMHTVAQAIATYYAGGYALDKVGGVSGITNITGSSLPTYYELLASGAGYLINEHISKEAYDREIELIRARAGIDDSLNVIDTLPPNKPVLNNDILTIDIPRPPVRESIAIPIAFAVAFIILSKVVKI